jgi:hypothetical protein
MTEITFPIPDGMVPPEGASEGSTFEALATLKLMDGNLALLEIDGLPVGMATSDEPIASTNDEDFISVIGNKFQSAQPPTE